MSDYPQRIGSFLAVSHCCSQHTAHYKVQTHTTSTQASKPPRGARRLAAGQDYTPLHILCIPLSLLTRYSFRMLRATRSVDTANVLALLHQYASYSRVLLTSRRLEHQIEETLDDLYDLGFNGQLLSNHLTATLQELRHFITRCDHAMRTLEQRIIHLCAR